jgi:hypothetical protein
MVPNPRAGLLARPPSIPPALARRIDRLALLAHAFHRFAHHPLCGRYQGELVPLGRKLRVCRGCSLALLGLAVGALAGWFSRSIDAGLTIWLIPATGLALTLLPLGRSKLLRRFLPALLLAAAACHGPTLVSLLSVIAVAALLLLYRRKGPNRIPCVTCPQRTLEVCEGFAPIVRRERAFQRLSGRWLAKEMSRASQ